MQKLGEKSLSQYKGFLFSDTTVIVASAIFVTPVVLGFSAKYTQKAGDKLWLYLIVIAFILFLVAGFVSGIIRAIFLGASLGVFFNAIIATSFGSKLASRLNSIGSS